MTRKNDNINEIIENKEEFSDLPIVVSIYYLSSRIGDG